MNEYESARLHIASGGSIEAALLLTAEQILVELERGRAATERLERVETALAQVVHENNELRDAAFLVRGEAGRLRQCARYPRTYSDMFGASVPPAHEAVIAACAEVADRIERTIGDLQ